jgi:alkanesulfonate monooxygenase SsuD/methylene tetrahydromethanopterin reductase-like flavin-dependent oxidoreductase (luciferase family)
MEIGLYTFAELSPETGGETISQAQRLRNLLEEVELAEQVGLDVFGVGEHHRPDFVVSAPAVVLAAAAERTERIRLTSAVSVISSDDPVRVFEEFATLDLLSGGRAEIMAGRGSFVESFPLFGYDLKHYDELFAEKLGLLLKLRGSVRVTWEGRHRPPIGDLGVYPRPVQDPLPIWIAVGGNPESAIRAGTLGLPMALAIIGGEPARRAVRQAPSPGGPSLGPRPGTADEHQLARLHRRDVPAGARRVVPLGRRHHEPHRTRASMGADAPRGLRRLGHPERRELRRQSAAGDREDPVPARDFRHDRFLLQFGVGAMPRRRAVVEPSAPRSHRSCTRRSRVAPRLR